MKYFLLVLLLLVGCRTNNPNKELPKEQIIEKAVEVKVVKKHELVKKLINTDDSDLEKEISSLENGSAKKTKTENFKQILVKEFEKMPRKAAIKADPEDKIIYCRDIKRDKNGLVFSPEKEFVPNGRVGVYEIFHYDKNSGKLKYIEHFDKGNTHITHVMPYDSKGQPLGVLFYFRGGKLRYAHLTLYRDNTLIASLFFQDMGDEFKSFNLKYYNGNKP